MERVDLGGLAPAETAQLATIVARAALDADDARRIHERTQGNPLFIGETVRASIEDGTLELRDGRMVLVEPGAPRLPLTLRAVLGARLDGLDEPARDVLSVASVVGIGFRQAELEDLLGVPIAPGTLDRLVDAGLIVPATGTETWRFSHPLVHETAYAGMLASRRRRLHARLADRLEAGRTPVTVETAGHPPRRLGRCGGAIPLLVEAADGRPRDGGPERGRRLLAERRRSGHRTRTTSPSYRAAGGRGAGGGAGARRPARPRARPRPRGDDGQAQARRRPGGSTGRPPRTAPSSSARRSGA